MLNKFNAWVEINLDNVAFNIKQIKQKLSDNVKVMAVVKANAYGHGACKIAQTVLANGADYLGVATCKESASLRAKGIKERIFITNALFQSDASDIIKYNLTPFVYTKELAYALNEEAKKNNSIIAIHIKIDTGMGRLGLSKEDFLPFLSELNKLKNLRIEGLLTHFSCADKDDVYTKLQNEKFGECLKLAETKGLKLDFIHAANSAAVIKYPFTHYNLVRPGLAIYGLYPSKDEQKLITLKPAMSIKAKIAFDKCVDLGISISYGRTFTTSKPSKIATIPIGYADGYGRGLSNKAEVLACGKRAKVVGIICMDNFMIDITDLPDIICGQEITLLGKENNEKITAEDLAEKSDTINYEIVTRIGYRLPRVYIKDNEVIDIEEWSK